MSDLTTTATGTLPPLMMPGQMSFAMQLFLDDRLFERAKLIAKYMAAADGITPGHLIGKSEACFAVVTRALTWKLDPFAVAQCTYQPVAGGRVGFEGKLVQAILENSGHLEGGLHEPEYYGDWSKVQGKWKWQANDRGKRYQVAAWDEKDEVGLGVIVRATVKGEKKPRELRFDLRQAHPRNSTLWATDPMTQLWYVAVRRFSSVRMPGVMMGLPFDGETEQGFMIDVTPGKEPIDLSSSAPRPTREGVRRRMAEDANQPPTQDTSGVQMRDEGDPQQRDAADGQDGDHHGQDLGQQDADDAVDVVQFYNVDINGQVIEELPYDVVDGWEKDWAKAYSGAINGAKYVKHKEGIFAANKDVVTELLGKGFDFWRPV